MSEFAEQDIEKVSTPPLVHDATLPDAGTDVDAGPKTGVLVAVVGAPFTGGVPTFDASLGYCVWLVGPSFGAPEAMQIYDEVTGVLGDLLDADGNLLYAYPE